MNFMYIHWIEKWQVLTHFLFQKHKLRPTENQPKAIFRGQWNVLNSQIMFIEIIFVPDTAKKGYEVLNC